MERTSPQALAESLREWAQAVALLADEVEALVPDIPEMKETSPYPDLLSAAVATELRPSNVLKPFLRFKEDA